MDPDSSPSGPRVTGRAIGMESSSESLPYQCPTCQCIIDSVMPVKPRNLVVFINGTSWKPNDKVIFYWHVMNDHPSLTRVQAEHQCHKAMQEGHERGLWAWAMNTLSGGDRWIWHCPFVCVCTCGKGCLQRTWEGIDLVCSPSTSISPLTRLAITGMWIKTWRMHTAG